MSKLHFQKGRMKRKKERKKKKQVLGSGIYLHAETRFITRSKVTFDRAAGPRRPIELEGSSPATRFVD